MTHYIGIVDGHGDVWGVTIPDFPGCHGGGATPDAAIADATSALREHAADMLADGEALPEPRSLGEVFDALQSSGDVTRGGVAYIPLLLDRGRSVRANVSLDSGLLEAIDAEAKRRGLTRSAFIASAAREKITQVR